MDQEAITTFIHDYVAMWHEHDPQRRHEIVRRLWAADAENASRTFVVRGLAEITGRVDRAHAQWVVEKGFVFRPLDPAAPADGHHDVVRFRWEMVPQAGGAAAARGLDIFVLRDDGRIGALYQFGEPLPV